MKEYRQGVNSESFSFLDALKKRNILIHSFTYSFTFTHNNSFLLHFFRIFILIIFFFLVQMKASSPGLVGYLVALGCWSAAEVDDGCPHLSGDLVVQFHQKKISEKKRLVVYDTKIKLLFLLMYKLM